jgi:hypothetical protein
VRGFRKCYCCFAKRTSGPIAGIALGLGRALSALASLTVAPDSTPNPQRRLYDLAAPIRPSPSPLRVRLPACPTLGHSHRIGPSRRTSPDPPITEVHALALHDGLVFSSTKKKIFSSGNGLLNEEKEKSKAASKVTRFAGAPSVPVDLSSRCPALPAPARHPSCTPHEYRVPNCWCLQPARCYLLSSFLLITIPYTDP